MSDGSAEKTDGIKVMPDTIEEMLQEDRSEETLETRVSSNLYQGKALNEEELYQMTAKEETKVILVAGMPESGKTTMELAIYQMFLRNKNKSLRFAGSKTLCGVEERSKELRADSGNSDFKVKRTSYGATDIYLHLVVMDDKGKKHNLVFTDLAGERFRRKDGSDDGLEGLFERYRNSSQVILLIDGQKLAGIEAGLAIKDSKDLFSRLMKGGIVGSGTMLHIVYTKRDLVEESGNPDIGKVIEENNGALKEMAEEKGCHVQFHHISAISKCAEKVSNYEGLEELVAACLIDLEHEGSGETGRRQIPYIDRSLAQRGMDKYAWKG